MAATTAASATADGSWAVWDTRSPAAPVSAGINAHAGEVLSVDFIRYAQGQVLYSAGTDPVREGVGPPPAGAADGRSRRIRGRGPGLLLPTSDRPILPPSISPLAPSVSSLTRKRTVYVRGALRAQSSHLSCPDLSPHIVWLTWLTWLAVVSSGDVGRQFDVHMRWIGA